MKSGNIDGLLDRLRDQIHKKRISTWVEKRPGCREPYIYARLGSKRFYVGVGQACRDEFLAKIEARRIAHHGCRASMAELLKQPKEPMGRKFRKIRDNALARVGKYLRSGRIHQRRGGQLENGWRLEFRNYSPAMLAARLWPFITEDEYVALQRLIQRKIKASAARGVSAFEVPSQPAGDPIPTIQLNLS